MNPSFGPLEEARTSFNDFGTLVSDSFEDIYYSNRGGDAETDHVFIQGNDLENRFARHQGPRSFVIGELGFGSGLNFLATADCFLKTSTENTRLTFISCEKYPLPSDIHYEVLTRVGAFAKYSLTKELFSKRPETIPGFHTLDFSGGRIRLQLLYGAAEKTLPELVARVDAWFLDGFTPTKNPDLWSKEVLEEVARHTCKDGTLATYSASTTVRTTLEAIGFQISKRPGFKWKREMMVGRYSRGTDASAPPKAAKIYGSGIAGLFLAKEFAAAGLPCTLIDPKFKYAGSLNPKAVIAPTFSKGPDLVHRFLWTAYLSIIREMEADLLTPGITRSGAIRLRETDQTEENFFEELAWLKLPTPILQIWSKEKLAEKMGEAWGEAGPAAFFPSAFTLNLPEFGASLFKELNGKVKLKISTTPPAAGPEDEALIFATGSDPDQLAKLNPVRVAPLKGQYLKIPMPTSCRIPAPILRRGNLIPDFSTGELWLGATFERDLPLTQFGPAESFRERFIRLWPEVNEMQSAELTSGWQGVRSSSRDHLPLVGKDYSSAHPHHYLFLGNGSKGVLGGYLGARILAARILGDPCPVEKSLGAAVDSERFKPSVEK